MSNTRFRPICAIVLALSPCIVLAQVIFSDGFEGDGGGVVITPQTCAPRTPAPIDCGTADFDGDGLPDCYETSIGTSPIFADSDGDEISDFDEIFTYFFDAQTNPYRFNPRIADVPLLNIEVADVPTINVLYETSAGNAKMISTEDSSTNTTQTTSSDTTSHSFGVEVQVKKKVGTETGLEGSITASWEGTWSNTTETSTAYSETFSRAQSATQQEGVTNTGGELLVSVNVINSGNLAVRVDELILSAGEIDFYPFLADPDNTPYFQPIGNLTIDNFPVGFPEFDLAPGAMTPAPLVFSNRGLSLPQTLELLRDASNLQIQTAVTQITDPAASDLGRSFTGAFNTIFGATAQILIDYGPNRGYDKFYVSTVGGPSNEISLADALCDVLELNVGTNQNAIARVEREFPAPLGVTANPNFDRQWHVTTLSAPQGGVEQSFDPNDGYNLNDIRLRAGQSVSITLIEDTDQDGLSDRLEFSFGSEPSADTDGDTLLDGFESLDGWMATYPGEAPYQVYSSPINVDADNDGFRDDQELANGTDPLRPDFNPDRSKRTPADFDADGRSDLLIGAPRTDVSGFEDAGSVYVHQLFGSGQSLEVTPINVEVTPINEGALSQPGASFGFSMTTGYINQDAYADAVIGVIDETNDGVTRAGGARVVFGSATGLDYAGAVKLSESLVWPTDPPNNPQSGDLFGYRLTTGDFNGDGLDDIVIGAPFDNVNGADGGRVYVLPGADGFELDPGRATLVTDRGGEAGEAFGQWVAAGDFDADGYDDLLIGTPKETIGAARAGDLSLIYGGASGLDFSREERVRQSQWAGQVEEADDNFGERFVVADFNQDGFDDAVIAAPGEDNGSGALYIALGSVNGLAPADDGLRLRRPSDRLGTSLAAGDFNNDGCPDLAAGQPANAVFVFYNTPDCESGALLDNVPAEFTHTDFENSDGDAVPVIVPDEDFGKIMSAGDFNNDGIPDLMIGAVRKDSRQDPNDDATPIIGQSGRAYLVFGQTARGLEAAEGKFRVFDHPVIPNSNGEGVGYLFGYGPN